MALEKAKEIGFQRGIARVEYGGLPSIYTAPQQLLLVFQNLISNGIKYNQSDTPIIQISYQQKNSYHQFSMADNGIGIEDELEDSETGSTFTFTLPVKDTAALTQYAPQANMTSTI